MLIEIAAIIIVLACIVGFVFLFNRRNSSAAKADDADDQDGMKELPEIPAEPEAQDGEKKTEIFVEVDSSNSQDATGYGYDASGKPDTAKLSFEDKLGKDTVVVELPAPKSPAKEWTSAPKPVEPPSKPKPARLGATPEELVKILERKITRRKEVLKVARVSESDDVTLKRYQTSLATLKAKIAESAIKAAIVTDQKDTVKPARKAPDKKKVEKKAAEKKVKKPAKKAPAKKPVRKSTKRAAKSSKPVKTEK